jgi:hypothetical protein
VSHLAGATAWSQGRWRAAAAHWEDAIAGSPHDLFALRCAHDAYAVLGDGAAMRGSLARVVPHWDAGIPGYASVLGMYAWSLHEAGLMAAAEETAGVSQSLDPSDGWANLSTVATLLAQGRWSESLSFLRHAADEWEAHEGAGCAAIVPWLHWYKTQPCRGRGRPVRAGSTGSGPRPRGPQLLAPPSEGAAHAPLFSASSSRVPPQLNLRGATGSERPSCAQWDRWRVFAPQHDLMACFGRGDPVLIATTRIPANEGRCTSTSNFQRQISNLIH